MNTNDNVGFDEMKTWDLVDYLAQMGFKPHHKRGPDFWYYSPLREEKNPSFKVTRKHNLWYDHGIGKGGSIIDFLMAFYNCSLKEVLEKNKDNFSISRPFSNTVFVPSPEPEKKIEIHAVQAVKSLVLERYLYRRKIPVDLGKKRCKEIQFSFSQKQFTALGFLNHSGGWELRNDWFKGSSSPKDISIIENGSSDLAVFEGFFDFLSYLKMYETSSKFQQDFLILNSTSFVERSIPLMSQYQNIKLFLDRDDTGFKCSTRLQEALPHCTDESGLYKGCKDINEWYMQSYKKTLQPIPKRLR